MDRELELFMTNLVKERSPGGVQEFISAISEGGVDQEEVDVLREVIMRAVSDPSTFPEMVGFLIRNDLIAEEDAPTQYDMGFVLTMLGLVGVAQELVGG
jgi:hypothetical protein